MDHVIEHRMPVIGDLGSDVGVIRGTAIKGHREIIEAIHWHIIHAYDFDQRSAAPRICVNH
jgi:hypothetical protein